MNAIIIGAGVIGCATAWELQKLGYAVTVLEKNGDAGHGSTSSSCGIVRRFYAQPGMIALAHESALTWADWGAHLGPVDDDLAVFERPGVLMIPPAIDDRTYAVVAREASDLAALDRSTWRPLADGDASAAWTDSFSSLWSAIDLGR